MITSNDVTEKLDFHAISFSASKPPPKAGNMIRPLDLHALDPEEHAGRANFNIQPRVNRKPRTLNIMQNATCGPAFGRAISPFLNSNGSAGSLSNGTPVTSASPNETGSAGAEEENGFGAKEFRDSYRLTRRRKLELTRSQLPECLHSSFLPNDDRVMLEEIQDEEKLREIMKETGILTIRGTSYAATIEELEHVGEVGHGVCGTVVKMRFKKTGDVIAVKQMRRSGNREENKRIIRDLEVILKSNDCPHIVQCYGCFVTESEVWICMELMTSCMEKLLHRARRLYPDDPSTRGIPEPIIGTMSLAVVKALHYLKEKHGVIHRDVKPSNILVDARTGRFKLCDFGISGRLVDSKAKTRTAGCAAYMAPERISPPDPKKPDYDIRADVWSFGISLYELATGSMPYKGCQGDFEVLTKIIEDDPPLLSPEDGFSIPFCSFLQACLTKDHKHRPKYHALLQHPFIRLYELKKIDIFEFLRSVTSNTQFLYQQQEMLLKPSVQQQEPTVTPQLPCMPLYQRLSRPAPQSLLADMPPVLPPKLGSNSNFSAAAIRGSSRQVFAAIAAPPPFVLAQPPARPPRQILVEHAGGNEIYWPKIDLISASQQLPTNATPSSISPPSLTSTSSMISRCNNAAVSPFSPSNIYELIRHRYWPQQQQQQQRQQQQNYHSTTSYYDWLQSSSRDMANNMPYSSVDAVASVGYVPFSRDAAVVAVRYTSDRMDDSRVDDAAINLPIRSDGIDTPASLSAKLANLFIRSTAEQQKLMLQRLQRLPQSSVATASLSRPAKQTVLPSSTSSSPGMLPPYGNSQSRVTVRDQFQHGNANKLLVSAAGAGRSVSASRARCFADNSSTNKFPAHDNNFVAGAQQNNNELLLLNGLNQKAATSTMRTSSLQDQYSSARAQQQRATSYRPRYNTYGAGYCSSSLTTPRHQQHQFGSAAGNRRTNNNRPSVSVDRIGGRSGSNSSAIVNKSYAMPGGDDF